MEDLFGALVFIPTVCLVDHLAHSLVDLAEKRRSLDSSQQTKSTIRLCTAYWTNSSTSRMR